MSLTGKISNNINTEEFDDDFFEWEQRDDKVSYLNHCLGNDPILTMRKVFFFLS
mgnify:FL=1